VAWVRQWNILTERPPLVGAVSTKLHIYIYINICVHKVLRQTVKKTYLEHFPPELTNIYLSRDIKSVSELYGQWFYIIHNFRDWACKRTYLENFSREPLNIYLSMLYGQRKYIHIYIIYWHWQRKAITSRMRNCCPICTSSPDAHSITHHPVFNIRMADE
jgi:hypothetical protein